MSSGLLSEPASHSTTSSSADTAQQSTDFQNGHSLQSRPGSQDLRDRNADRDHQPRAASDQQRSDNAQIANDAIHSTVSATTPVDDSNASTATPGSGNRPSSRNSGSRASRGMNANHLLHFQYQTPTGGLHARGSRGGGGRGNSFHARVRGQGYTRPEKYDRKKFLQANYRFLVSDAVDATAFHADADRMFNWDDVLQVEMLSSTPVQCPISLDSPPTCPQITPCGHIYSFPAIIQHLAYHGGDQLRRWAPCPLCFEPVVARDLRMAVITPVKAPKPGVSMTFQLLKRGRTTIIPQEIGQPNPAASSSSSSTSMAENIANASKAGASNKALKAGAEQTKSTADGPGVPGTSTDAAGLHPLASNRYAKFAVVGIQGATNLWREVAKQLAEHAAEVTSEGGPDAAATAPYIFMSLEALAGRARRWATRRAEVMLDKAAAIDIPGASVVLKPGPTDGSPTPDMQGAEAEAAVKEMFVAAVQSVAQQALPQPREQFPVLGGKKTQGSNNSAAVVAEMTRQQATTQQQQQQQQQKASSMPDAEFVFQAAFSDSDDETAMGAVHSSPRAASPTGGTANGSLPAEGSPASMAAPVETTEPVGGTNATTGPATEPILGTSPNSLTAVNAANVCGDYYMYQSTDGQWVFLDPLCVRCLLAHYGSYETCPTTITATLLDLERIEQNEASRKRWKFLAHLPLKGAFYLAEVDMREMLPASALAPFADELAAREQRRKRRARDERRMVQAEAAAARAAAAARRGPTAKELAAMPALSEQLATTAAAAALAAGPQATLADAEALAAARALGFTSAEELSESLALQASLDAATGPGSSPPSAGVSFANIAKLGFAATGPSLMGTSPPLAGPSNSSNTSTGPQGAWASKGRGNTTQTTKGTGSASGWPATVPGNKAAAGASLLASSLMQGLGVPLAALQSSNSQASASSRHAAEPSLGHVPVAAQSQAGGSWSQAAATSPAPASSPAGAASKKQHKKGTLLFTSGPARRY